MLFNNDGATAQIYVYGDIGRAWDDSGTTAQEFVDALNEAAGKPIDLHINSGGGDVFEAHAMHAALGRYTGAVTAYIDGLAASAASYFAMNADHIVIASHALMMIHKASMFTYGNADQLRESAATLDMLDATLCDIYAKRATISREEIAEKLAAETWLTAAEALAMGLVDEIDDSAESVAAKVSPQIVAAWHHNPLAEQTAGADDAPQQSGDEPATGADDAQPVEDITATDTEPTEGDAPEPAQERTAVVLESGIYYTTEKGETNE